MSKKLLMNNYSENGLMPVTDGLVCWLDARDLKDTNDGTIWKDRSGNGHHATLKRKDLNSIPVIENGYYRTYDSGYVILPTLKFNSTDGISIFLDFKVHNYTRLFTLGYNNNYKSHLAAGTGLLEFGTIRFFSESTVDRYIYFSDAMFNKKINMSISYNNNIMLGKNHNLNITRAFGHNDKFDAIFNCNYLNAENSSTTLARDTSYGLILIYNRALTEEEINQNYLYEQSIKRGE